MSDAIKKEGDFNKHDNKHVALEDYFTDTENLSPDILSARERLTAKCKTKKYYVHYIGRPRLISSESKGSAEELKEVGLNLNRFGGTFSFNSTCRADEVNNFINYLDAVVDDLGLRKPKPIGLQEDTSKKAPKNLFQTTGGNIDSAVGTGAGSNTNSTGISGEKERTTTKSVTDINTPVFPTIEIPENVTPAPKEPEKKKIPPHIFSSIETPGYKAPAPIKKKPEKTPDAVPVTEITPSQAPVKQELKSYDIPELKKKITEDLDTLLKSNKDIKPTDLKAIAETKKTLAGLDTIYINIKHDESLLKKLGPYLLNKNMNAQISINSIRLKFDAKGIDIGQFQSRIRF